MGGSRESSPIVLISDDDEEEENLVAPPVAAVNTTDDEYDDELPAGEGWYEDLEIPRPDWLPDGFIMVSYREADGTTSATNFICPASEISFGTKTEVLDYCFSGGMERASEARNTLSDKTTLQGKYAWLRGDHRWLLEIRRAGGENGKKMFKVYTHPSSEVRIKSKAEVMRLIKRGKLPDESTNNVDCNDMSNEDNIIAQLDFNVESLPPGWVKETAFRKSSDGIRKDNYYTDPVTKKVFRTVPAAEQYFMYGKVTECYKPSMTVTDLYFFDGCMDMPPLLAKRLKMDGTNDQCEEECHTSSLGCFVNDQLGHRLTIEVGEDGKEVLHGDSKEKLDEEECHHDDNKEEDKEEAPYGNGNGNEKEDNEEMPHGDGKEEKNELGAVHASDKVGMNGEGMPHGDGVEDDEDQQVGWRTRSLTELYSVRIKKGNLKRKGKKKF